MKQTKIRKVAVLGSGVMGSGIAAHLANAGIPVLMLDILPPGLDPAEQNPRRRSQIALGSLERLAKSKPPLLYSARRAALIEAGNFEDHWARLAEVDWIVEVVVERLDVKQQLFARLESVWKPGQVISSNTSGLSLAAMVEGRSLPFRQHFLVTHFFNPVRYMHLLEIVAGADTLPEVVATLSDFGRRRLGKGIVYGKDTPNFVANRLGIHGTMAALGAMMELGYQLDEVDAAAGVGLARPKSAIFDTADVVGIDTMLHVAATSRQLCASDHKPADEDAAVYQVPDFLQQLVAAGQLGRKAGGGFYRMERGPGGSKTKLVLDWQSGQYRPVAKPDWPSLKAAAKLHDPAERVRTLIGGDDRGSALAWRLLRDGLAYAAHRLGEIADTVHQIDCGMRWGYSWELGPFEAWDALGVAPTVTRMQAEGVQVAPWVEAMLAAGCPSFYRDSAGGREQYDPRTRSYQPLPTEGTFLVLGELKRTQAPAWSNPSATLLDLGDGIAGLELRSRHQPRLNPLDDEMVAGLLQALQVASERFQGLVIGHEGENFCVGANLYGVLQLIKEGRWKELEATVRGFQQATTSLRRAPIPVVVAPFGQTFGGGAELTLGGDAVCAHAETYLGLVEVGVGLVPGGGGHLFVLERLLDEYAEPISENIHPIKRAFETIALAKVSGSAEEARELGYLRRGDHVEILRERLLWSAKRMALAAAELGYQPPAPRTFRLPGRKGIATLKMMVHNMRITHWATEHDELIAGHIARVLCGGDTTLDHPVSEQTLLDLEREAFLSLCGEPRTQERMEHMLKTGKPLRN